MLACDASLAWGPQSTYVRGADGYYSRLRRIQPPVQRWYPRIFGVPTFPAPLRSASASRAADETGRLRAPGGVRSQASSPRIGFERRPAPISDPRRGPQVISSGATRHHLAFGNAKRPLLPPKYVPDGPTPDAPNCVADQNQRNIRPQAERQLRSAVRSARVRVGPAPFAFRPSPHPRIRWTVASADSASSARGPTRPPPPRVQKCPTRC